MSFGRQTNFPAPTPVSFGEDPSLIPTKEQARAVPYFAGTRPVGLTYLGQAFRFQAFGVYQGAKKVQILSGYNYYGSFVALLGHGELAGISEVRINNQVVWPDNGKSSFLPITSDLTIITVAGRGNLRIYRGSDTQTQDPHAALAEADVGDFHPAYRGLAYVVAEDWFIGYNNSTVPQITLTVSRWPQFAWLTNDSNVSMDCNPVAFLADLVTNPRAGLGAPDTRLNKTELDTMAIGLRDECVGLSPLENTGKGFRQFALETLEHCDGYLKPSADGKFSLGVMRGDASDPPVFDETCLLEPPDIDPGDWMTTLNAVYVTYTNRDNNWEKMAEAGLSQANFAVSATLKSKTFERPGITRQHFAGVLANIISARMGTPPASGKGLKVRRSKLGGLTLGGVFALNWGDLGACHLKFRAVAIEIAKSQSPYVTIDFEEDRGNFNARYFSPAVQDPPIKKIYTAEPLVYQAMLELPFAPDFPDRTPRYALLAARPNLQTTRFSAWRKKSSGSYEFVEDVGIFAFRGKISAAYPAATPPVDAAVRLTVQLVGADQTLGNTNLPGLPLAEAVTNDWLLWIADSPAATGPGNESQANLHGEILSVFDAQLVSAGVYNFATLRGRFDTASLAHAMNAECWLFRRADLPKITVTLATPGNPETFKLQPFVLGSALDLADADAVSAAYLARSFRPWAPGNLRANGSTAPTITAEDLVLEWDTRSDLRPPGLAAFDDPLVTTVKIARRLSDHSGEWVLSDTLAAGVTTKTWTRAELAAALGASTAFRVLAWNSLPAYGLFSRHFATINGTLL
ncbi:MAG: hypothetical protein HY301_02750 [Verrucomicrobia bacterium]|nr:hypothetical protein [Verrucomicrobiota bacterium]